MKIARIILHCSDSPDNVDIGVKEIRAWHTAKPPNGRGWRDIGYHYVVRRNGVVEVGRYENGDSVLEGTEIGAHVAGHNRDALGICWVGRKAPTRAQKLSLLKHVLYLMDLHAIPIEQVYGHYEFDKNKTCPNLDMEKTRREISLFKTYGGLEA